MKTILVGAVAVLALIGVVVYYEGRISDVKDEMAALEKATPKSSPGAADRRLTGAGNTAGGETGKSGRSEIGVAGSSSKDGQPKEGDWAETFRQMMENPVGAAMIKEEFKGKALRIYGDFMDTLDLNKKEREYFLGLVASGVGEDDTVGMKLFGAKTEEEAVAILDQMEADQKSRRDAIKKFLNSDEDFERYDHFEERKEIYEQMPGLRTALDETGKPIDDAQEEQLVEAIFEASNSSGLAEAWQGRAGMEQFARPGATQRFKDQWEETQTILNQNVGTILEDSEQQTAFREHQNQIGNMVTFQLQFVEGMIAGQKGGGE